MNVLFIVFVFTAWENTIWHSWEQRMHISPSDLHTFACFILESSKRQMSCFGTAHAQVAQDRSCLHVYAFLWYTFGWWHHGHVLIVLSHDSRKFKSSTQISLRTCKDWERSWVFNKYMIADASRKDSNKFVQNDNAHRSLGRLNVIKRIFL